MVDLEDGELITLAKASHLIPGRPSLNTISRWCRTGVGNPRVKLEMVKIGGRVYTSKEALVNFVQQLSRNKMIHNPKANQRIENAEQRLNKQWSRK